MDAGKSLTFGLRRLVHIHNEDYVCEEVVVHGIQEVLSKRADSEFPRGTAGEGCGSFRVPIWLSSGTGLIFPASGNSIRCSHDPPPAPPPKKGSFFSLSTPPPAPPDWGTQKQGMNSYSRTHSLPAFWGTSTAGKKLVDSQIPFQNF